MISCSLFHKKSSNGLVTGSSVHASQTVRGKWRVVVAPVLRNSFEMRKRLPQVLGDTKLGRSVVQSSVGYAVSGISKTHIRSILEMHIYLIG